VDQDGCTLEATDQNVLSGNPAVRFIGTDPSSCSVAPVDLERGEVNRLVDWLAGWLARHP
jgi:hypothetical protein